ncbi:MAG: hypothetical protein ACKPCP_33210 [Sphaerospermopsis kisseleviana]
MQQTMNKKEFSQREKMYQKGLKDIESLSPEIREQWEILITTHPWVTKNMSKPKI